MSTQYRAALIGCGGISARQATAYLEQGNVELVAGCDINPDNLSQRCDEFEIPGRYTSHEALFEAEKGLDFVSICTYPKAHAEQTIAAAAAGVRGVMCEKPMCISLNEADAMIDACRKSGTRLAIAHRHRQNPNFTKARELVAEGAIGEPRLIWCYLTSAIIDNGTHMIDMMRYLLGDPKTDWVMGQASRRGDTLYQQSPAEESGVGLIAFKTGTRAVMETGELVPEDGFQFRILGTDGNLEATQTGVDLIDRTGAKAFQEPQTPGFVEQTRELIAWVEGGPGHRNTGEIARATTEILMAIHESARTRELVHLPLTVGDYPMQVRVDEEGR